LSDCSVPTPRAMTSKASTNDAAVARVRAQTSRVIPQHWPND